MEQFFTSLNKRQTMLLLTAATFGGQESIGIFDHLPEDEAELLRHRAEGLAKIPREKRVPLLVQEIKRLVTARRGQLWSADPERLAQVLKGERAALVEVILRALPQGTADAVRKHLPKMAPVKLQHEVRPQILHIVRWKLEEALVKAAPKRPGFKFSDVLLLKSREVLTLCDRLGARALAQAIAGLPEADREAFLGKLKPDQRQLAAKAATDAAARALTEEDAKQILAPYGAEKDASIALTSAGAQRLARASIAQSPEFAARLVERHPGALGQLLLKWVREERPRVTGKVDGGRTDVVGELEKLEQQGIIDKPVRLAPPPAKAQPPPSRPPPSAPPSELPGGKILPPRPRGMIPPPPLTSNPPSQTNKPYRDAIAERNARKAGALSSRAMPSLPESVADEPQRPDRAPSRVLPPAPERSPSRAMSPAPDRPDRSPSRVISPASEPQRPDRAPSRVNPSTPDRPGRPGSQVLQPFPQARGDRSVQRGPPSLPDVPVRSERAPGGGDDPREHRAVGYDTAKRRNDADARGDPPTSPRKGDGSERNDRTSLQRAPRSPSRGPKGGG